MDRARIFKLVWRGWFVGASAIFIPLSILGVLVGDISREMMLIPLLVPVITAIQGAIAGGLVVLGLTIWPSKS